MKIPKPVNLPKEAIIVAIAAGWDSSYAITGCHYDICIVNV